MAGKQKGPVRVEVVTHPDWSEKVIIHLEKDLTFSAKMPDGSVLVHNNGSTLRQQVHAWLRDNLKLEWQAVIEVVPLSPFGSPDLISGAFLGFTLNRFWWAKKAGDGRGYVRTGWEHDGKPNFTTSFSVETDQFMPPVNSNGRFYLPYSDESWVGLQRIIAALKTLKANLDAMIQSDDGQAQIAQLGASLMTTLLLGSGAGNAAINSIGEKHAR